MLRNSFALIIIAFFLALAQAEEKIASATSVETKEEARPAVETDFKKAPSIDPNIKITKIHEFRNDEHYNPGGNPALEFEQLYWNHGAILGDEIESRRGHYFVISWANKGPAANFTTRFEYRQVKTKDVVRVLTMDHSNVKGASRSTFAVLGDAYRAYGPVVSWRFTVLQGGKVVGEEKSFIW